MIQCKICPHNCKIKKGELGFCGARINRDGRIVADNYGKITSIGLDPVEKKPLKRFFPGSFTLSVGSYGCNLRCSFCQNYGISMRETPGTCLERTPGELVNLAMELVPQGNIGLSYTYNEPLVGYEFVMDCAKLSVDKGLKNILVTNGYINEKPLAALLPYIHALNIDLKSFSPEFYKRINGELEVVKRTIALASEKCHVEVTTLVIPNENDSEEEMREMSKWLASVDNAIPLHISRFFPNYQMMDKEPTPKDTIHRLADIARQSLLYVYKGNM